MILSILILIIVVSLLLKTPRIETFTNDVSQSVFHPDTHWFYPRDNLFKRKFYWYHKRNYNVVASPVQYNMLQSIIGNSHTYTSIDSVRDNPIGMLNRYQSDFVVTPELTLHDITTPISPSTSSVTSSSTSPYMENIRFIAGLYSSNVTIISTNNHNIIDIGDIKHYSCDTTIAIAGDEKSASFLCLNHILDFYGTNTQNKINIVFGNDDSIYDRYGSEFSMYFKLVDQHPDQTIKRLTDKIPSHMVTMKNINNGSLVVKADEKPFYEKYPTYNKSSVDLHDLLRWYPLLTDTDHGSVFIPTIKSKHVLLTHNKMTNKKVEDIVHKVLYSIYNHKLFKGVHVTDLHYIRNIPLHEGANKVYHQIHLHKMEDTGRSFYSI